MKLNDIKLKRFSENLNKDLFNTDLSAMYQSGSSGSLFRSGY